MKAHDKRHTTAKQLLECVLVLQTVMLLQAWQGDSAQAETVALWLFDEQQGLYPSCVLGDASTGNHPLVLGLGGQIVEGKFGNALEPLDQPPVEYHEQDLLTGIKEALGVGNGMTWVNARFCALMTRGERHLRQEVGFASPTQSRLNLGDVDWTVEFWYLPTRATEQEGVVFEVGEGPRAENDRVTRLVLNIDLDGFTLLNQPSGVQLLIPSDPRALAPGVNAWHHLAFVHDAARGQLRHYVDGVLQPLPEKCGLEPLGRGRGDYMSIGRDATWKRPLPGRIDEMRWSDTRIYSKDFVPPRSFSRLFRSDYVAPQPVPGPPLLFHQPQHNPDPIPLGHRKHLFIDDALVADMQNVTLQVNPPIPTERVLDVKKFGKHLVVFEDDDGLIRLYHEGPKRSLAVTTSRDGVHWEKPDLGRVYGGARNVVIEDPVGLGTIFLDPNAPLDERIKYFSGYRGRGSYIYTSPDGFTFKRNETAALPFRAASQSIAFYDDQRQKYVGYHRTDIAKTVGRKTERTFVMTEADDVMRPWPFRRVPTAEHAALAEERRLSELNPWYLDNGPLTPPGFGIEYPTVFAPDDTLDPVATDIYVPKCLKYAWAPDTYLAFPIVYFHYHGDGPQARQVLGERERGRGSGPTETQLAVSRDGIHWKRYPRPAYIGIGPHEGVDVHQAYIAHGIVRRGKEIWQYCLGTEKYHSSWTRRGKDALFRFVQRLDGFVSADAPYTGGVLKTKPFTFDGSRLILNIDTDAAGFAQVGFLDERGEPIDGFSVDDCVYINGDFVDMAVEWSAKGTDLSALAGRPVQLVFRMQGTKLYSMQFVDR